MRELKRGPATFGQLSVWRSMEHFTPERMRHANIGCTWELPAGCTTNSVWQALGTLEARHESLRTGYVVNDDRGLEQLTWEPSSYPVAAVELGNDARGGAERVTEDLGRELFRLDHERPWRRLIVTDHGRPTSLALVVHHIAADGSALDVLQGELLDLLAGRPLAAPMTNCQAIAEQQRSAGWAQRRRSAADHFRGVLAGAKSVPDEPLGPAPVQGRTDLPEMNRSATLRSAGLTAVARTLAARLEVTLHAVLFAAFCRSLAERTGQRTFVVLLMSGNRNDMHWRSVVGSFNQVTTVLVHTDLEEGFAALARRLHRDALVAYLNGCYDVDAHAQIAAEYGRYGHPTFGFPYLFTLNPADWLTTSESTASASVILADHITETCEPGSGAGFPLAFIAGNGDASVYTIRESSRAPDGIVTRTHLESFRRIILEASVVAAEGTRKVPE